MPELDPLALRYVEEALRAFNARCYLATSVMLGVASEQVFNRLAAAFVKASGDSAVKLEKLIDDPGKTYFTRFQELRRRLDPIRDSLPDGLGDVLTLDAVGDLLRVTRNAAGHPSGQSIDEDTARTHLHMAALYLGKMTALQGTSPAQPAAHRTDRQRPPSPEAGVSAVVPCSDVNTTPSGCGWSWPRSACSARSSEPSLACSPRSEDPTAGSSWLGSGSGNASGSSGRARTRCGPSSNAETPIPASTRRSARRCGPSMTTAWGFPARRS